MKFSAQEEYGLRCLLQIARLQEDESMTILEISKLEGLTQPHVAKLTMILRKGGFIKSTRGQTGGYTLARGADDILLGDVLNALGGKLYDAEFCTKHSGYNSICTHDIDCSVRSVWQVVQTAVDNVVYKITLSDLMKQKEPVSNVQLYSEPRRLQPIRS
jgi:Rrf2 family protein